jgi:hypothetical protein
MKRALAVGLLMMSFAAVAFADGPDLPPHVCAPGDGSWWCPHAATKTELPINSDGTSKLLLADGPGLPPAGLQKAPGASVVLLADGPGLPPASLQKAPEPKIEI